MSRSYLNIRFLYSKKTLLASWAFAIVCLASAITAYFNFRYIFLFVICNGIGLLILTCLVCRRILTLWRARQQGKAGSHLHIRIVSIFSLLVITPIALMAFFFVSFVHLGVDAWFHHVVQTAIHESRQIGESYWQEHYKTMERHVHAIVRELEGIYYMLARDPVYLAQFLTAHADLRHLSDALIMNKFRTIIARSHLSFLSGLDGVNSSDLQKANDKIVIYPSPNKDRIIAWIKLPTDHHWYLMISRHIDPKVIERMTMTREAADAYEVLLSQRQYVTLNLLFIFALLTLLLLFLAIWGGLNAAIHLMIPIGQLIGAAGQVKSGDFSARVSFKKRKDELGELGDEFNQMVAKLDFGRTQLIQANQQLEKRRTFIEGVLSGVSSGVLGLDSKGMIHVQNDMAKSLLTPHADIKPLQLKTVAPEFIPLFQKAQQGKQSIIENQVTIERQGRIHILRVILQNRSSHATETANSLVMTFDDITELLVAQRHAAWSEMARRVAHEIKNPLTPIQLSAERLKRKYISQIHQNSDQFLACINTIVRQVKVIGNMVGEFASFARLPQPQLKSHCFVELCTQAITLQASAYHAIKITSALPHSPVSVLCDAEQILQLITNILKNAIESIEERLKRNPTPGHIHVQLIPKAETVILTIQDNGTGFPNEGREKLTEPYMTTKVYGTGLGLAIVKKIVEDHKGELYLENAENGFGGRIVIILHAESAKITPNSPVNTYSEFVDT